MSHRSRTERKLQRLRKNLARKPLPAFIDLVDYLKLHGHADTTGQAVKVILAERVKSESHTLGIRPQNQITDHVMHVAHAVNRLVPASYRNTIQVLPK